MKNDVQVLLSKQVDRRDFLKHVGLALIAATGIGAALRSATGVSTQQRSSGFGAGAYGGPRHQ